MGREPLWHVTARLERLVARLGAWLWVPALALLGLSLLTPLYTDEVGYKAQVVRILDDGAKMVSVLPQCAGSHVLPVPASWWPAALVHAALFRPLGLLGLKVSGALLVVLWFALAWKLLGTFGRGPRRRRAFAVFAAAHLLGVVPFTLVMARAEGMLLLCLLVFMGFAVGDWFGRRATTRGRALAFAGFALTVSVFFFSHSKTVLFAPVVLACTALAFPRARGRGGWLALALAWVLLTAGQTYVQASRTSRCPEVPYLEDVFGLLVLRPNLARTAPDEFVRLGLEDVAKASVAIVKDMQLTPTYPAGWLPPMDAGIEVAKLPALADVGNAATRVGLWSLQGSALVLGALALALALARRASRPRRAAAYVAGSLLFCLGGHMFFTKHWPFYHTHFAVPLLAAIVALGGAALAPRMRRARLLIVIATGAFVAASLVSGLVTAVHMAPRLFARTGRPGTLLPDQPASVPPLHYDGERESIRAHAARCGIQGDGATHLLIDDATLFAFDRLYRPVHLIYVTDAAMWGIYMPGEKNVAFLRSLDLSGMITRCEFLPTALAPKMLRDGRGYCCLGPDAFRAQPVLIPSP
jgi:hypothetical protein